MERNKERAGKFQTFENLEAYQLARGFRRAMDRLAEKLPETEKFGLTTQIRRAAVSLTNNIAEGHGRYYFPDQIKFRLQSRGLPEELLDDLNVCEDERYLAKAEIEGLIEGAWRAHKVINGSNRFLRSRMIDKSPRLEELPTEWNEDGGELIPFNPSSA